MKEREKVMVGALMIAGGLGILIAFGGGQWDALSSSMSQSDSLKTEIEGLTAQKTMLNASITALEKQAGLSNDIVIRKFNPNNMEEQIKAMIDGVVNEATDAGNRLISIEPYQEEAPPPPPPSKDDKKSEDKPAEGDAASGDDKDKVEEPPPPQLSTFGYQIAVRGNFNSIQQFLHKMADNKELLEVKSIKLENEAGADRTANQGTSLTEVPSDPSKPLKLTTKVKMVLQPE